MHTCVGELRQLHARGVLLFEMDEFVQELTYFSTRYVEMMCEGNQYIAMFSTTSTSAQHSSGSAGLSLSQPSMSPTQSQSLSSPSLGVASATVPTALEAVVLQTDAVRVWACTMDYADALDQVCCPLSRLRDCESQ